MRVVLFRLDSLVYEVFLAEKRFSVMGMSDCTSALHMFEIH